MCFWQLDEQLGEEQKEAISTHKGDVEHHFDGLAGFKLPRIKKIIQAVERSSCNSGSTFHHGGLCS